MQVQMAPQFQPASAQALRARVTAPQAEAAPSGDSFVQSATGDKIKSALVFGGISLVGAALGAYAGLRAGILPGLAGLVAGASGGALVATKLPGEPIKGGAIVGAIAGTLVGATVAHPVAAVALGLAGATAPVGLLLAVFAGAE